MPRSSQKSVVQSPQAKSAKKAKSPKAKRQAPLSELSAKQVGRLDLVRSLHKVVVEQVLKAKLASENQVGDYEDFCEFLREFFDANVESEDKEDSEAELSESESADERMMEKLEEGTSWSVCMRCLTVGSEEEADELSDADMYSEEEEED